MSIHDNNYSGDDNFDPPPPYDAPDPEVQRLQEFRVLLWDLTPRVWVTPTILAVNVAVLAVMAICGVPLLMPGGDALIAWGADYGPLTLQGQWWRMLACVFLHYGIIHLGVNMWALWAAGQLLERFLGNVGFLLLYLLAGLGGSMASLWWNPTVASAGASGAVFGVFGALVGFSLRCRGTVQLRVAQGLRGSIATVVVFNLVAGAGMSGVDHAAHVGGLLTGLLGGLVLGQRLDRNTPRRRLFHNAAIVLLAVLLAAAFYARRPAAPTDLVALRREWNAVQSQTLDRYNSAHRQAVEGKMNALEFADIIQHDVLPPWRAQRERWEAVHDVPAKEMGWIRRTVSIQRLLEESFQLQVEAIHENDARKTQLAGQKMQEANKLSESAAKPAKP